MTSRRGVVVIASVVVIGVLVVTLAVATGGPRTGGPLARPELFWEDDIPLAPDGVLTWGMVLPTNWSSAPVTMISVEPTVIDGVDVVETLLHDPDVDGAVGGHVGPLPDGLHALPVEGAVMAPSTGHLEAVFVVRVGDGRDRGKIEALRLLYRHEGIEYEDVVRLSLVVRMAKSREWPFGFAFLQLEQSARRARTVVIAGYSFRDEAVNERLRAAARTAERRWIVINKPTDSDAYISKVEAVLTPARPDFILTGFEGGLPAIG